MKTNDAYISFLNRVAQGIYNGLDNDEFRVKTMLIEREEYERSALSELFSFVDNGLNPNELLTIVNFNQDAQKQHAAAALLWASGLDPRRNNTP